jgi:hypothetical protein
VYPLLICTNIATGKCIALSLLEYRTVIAFISYSSGNIGIVIAS